MQASNTDQRTAQGGVDPAYDVANHGNGKDPCFDRVARPG